MKNRCYNSNELIKRPTYIGCFVDDSWMDFQRFAYDYEHMVGYGLPDRHLDKDILVKGNTVYSNNTCVLVPNVINTLLTYDKCNKGLYPTGVIYTPNKTPSYMARIRKHGSRVFIGRYHTPEEAYNAYKQTKEQHIKDMAELYKHELDARAYNSLRNWII